LKGHGAILVDDPFARTDFADIALNGGEFDDRGLESIAYDMANYLRRLGRSAAACSFAALKALAPEDPFAAGGILAMHVDTMPILRKSLEDPKAPPDLSAFLAPRLPLSEDFQCGDGGAPPRCAGFPAILGAIAGRIRQ
jgi:amidase